MRISMALVVSSGLGYKLWIQHNAVLSEDNEVFDPGFWVEGFFCLWQNVDRFFSTAIGTQIKNLTPTRKDYDSKRSIPTN